MPHQRRFAALYRIFSSRFLENDVIMSGGDNSSALAAILGLLVAPGFFIAFFEFIAYSSWPLGFQPWDMRDLAALPDKALHIGVSMTVIGVATILHWDALLLDRRDIAVLRTLPVPMVTVFCAKALALVRFWLFFCVAASALPTLLFPMVILQRAETSLLLRFIGAHALSVLAGNAFLFLSLLALQSLVLVVFGYRRYRAAAPWLRAFVIATLLGAFFFTMGVAFEIDGDNTNAHVLRALPVVWFVGLYQTLLGWPHELFYQLAARAVFATCIAALTGVMAYACSYRKILAAAFEDGDLPVTGTPPSAFRRRVEAFAHRVFLRQPSERAAFHFVSAILLSGGAAPMLIAAWLGAGFALIFQSLTGFMAAGDRSWWSDTRGPLLAAPATIFLVLVLGTRYAFTIPEELRANWLFQLSGALQRDHFDRGVRKAVACFLILPISVSLGAIYSVLWGVGLGCIHIVFHTLMAWLLFCASLLQMEKLPFTCAYVAGKSDLKSRWPLYIAGYLGYIGALLYVERWMLDRWMLHRWNRAALILALLLAAIAGLRYYHRRCRTLAPLQFDELPAPTVQTLELSQ